MKYLPYLIISTLWFSCQNAKETETDTDSDTQTSEYTFTVESNFQTILDSAKVTGSVLIYDPEKKEYHANNFDLPKKGHLPASTFKIPNSIIAFETKVVESDTTLFKWDGKPRALAQWEQDLTFTQAFHLSCVPCYQEVARRIGPERMNQYLQKFDYGKMIVDSNNLDVFWLEGESTITQVDQIHFLEKLYTSKLDISTRTESIMKQMMIIQEFADLKVSGKTGWAIRNGSNIGWFVGYLEKDKKVYYFATNIQPTQECNMDRFATIRKSVTYLALKEAGFLEVWN
jgi:beta-lactamase class D